MRLAIVGGFDGAHVGGSLARAAESVGVEAVRFDTADAMRGERLFAMLRWRLFDRQPLRLSQFSTFVLEQCRKAPFDTLIATGSAALTGSAVDGLRGLGVFCVNFSTDDPWNATLRSDWHLRALPAYDIVFTTRRANLADMHALGCRDVRYLPFGYDDALFSPPSAPVPGLVSDVLFVGGADKERAAFMAAFMRAGPPVALVGGYWNRFQATRGVSLGQKTPEEVCALTASAGVNLCLVRRANRDGHVMRSLEIAAIGGCMLVEDTLEHRAIFGEDGDCVTYFRNPDQAATRARALIANANERARLATRVRQRILAGHHTYRDRLMAMMEAAERAARDERKPWRGAGR